MNTTTDYIIIALFLYFFFRGWNKGLFKTLLGPLSLIAGCVMGYVYYQKNHNIATSLAICMVGPFVISFLASILLKFWHQAVNDDLPLPVPSRFMGGVFSVAWGACYLAIMLVLIGVVPLRISWFEKVQKDVVASKSYAMINSVISEKMPANVPDVKRITDVLRDPAKLSAYQDTEEFKALRTDEQLNDLISDKETAEQIKNKDYAKLLSNPKMQEVFRNEALLRKILALNQRIMEENPIPDEEPLEPKVINIAPQ